MKFCKQNPGTTLDRLVGMSRRSGVPLQWGVVAVGRGSGRGLRREECNRVRFTQNPSSQNLIGVFGVVLLVNRGVR